MAEIQGKFENPGTGRNRISAKSRKTELGKFHLRFENQEKIINSGKPEIGKNEKSKIRKILWMMSNSRVFKNGQTNVNDIREKIDAEKK